MGGNKHNIYPPLDNHRTRFRRSLQRLVINIFVLLGLGLLYYLVFSSFFDTPAEYRVRQQTALLRAEYEQLTMRMEEIEAALENVQERDRNVFRMLFEAEPYNIADAIAAASRNPMDELMAMTNNELGLLLGLEANSLERRLTGLDNNYMALLDSMQVRLDSLNFIPSIQPVINKDLTLLTASFGMRFHPFFKSLSQHNGVDYTVAEGSRVFATADGVVKESVRRPSSSGLTVVIDHKNGYETHYNHLSNAIVRKGQAVRRGDIIALTGNTGLSSSPHLHYEIRYNGEPVDPVNYFFLELGAKDYLRLRVVAQSGMQSFD